METETTGTLRNAKCHGATVTFGEWRDALDRAASARGNPYGPGGATANTGDDAWWLYYEMGYSPEGALGEDQSYD